MPGSIRRRTIQGHTVLLSNAELSRNPCVLRSLVCDWAWRDPFAVSDIPDGPWIIWPSGMPQRLIPGKPRRDPLDHCAELGPPPIRGYAMSRGGRGKFRCIHKPRTMPRPLLSVVNVTASHRFHYRSNRENASTRDCGVDAHGKDASVMTVVDKVFGGAVLIRRSPSRR
jgi:hypothetical protein